MLTDLSQCSGCGRHFNRCQAGCEAFLVRRQTVRCVL